MAYDEGLAERVRDYFSGLKNVSEKKMFGGLAFMLNGNMCVGINNSLLMARVGKDHYETLIQKPHAQEMDFTGKSLKGFIYVDENGTSEDDDLYQWLTDSVNFVKTLPAK